jgi:hypothetical protein
VFAIISTGGGDNCLHICIHDDHDDDDDGDDADDDVNDDPDECRISQKVYEFQRVLTQLPLILVVHFNT